MSFTTVWNPSTKPNRPRKLWTFYISSKFNLGLRQWDKNEKANVYWEDKPEVPKGPLEFSAPLASFQLRDWTRCYGVTTGTKPDATKDSYFISLLSPVWRSMSVEVARPVLAGVSDGDANAWLYYLSTDETIKVVEREILESGSGGDPNVVDGDVSPLIGSITGATSTPTTQLAAYWNPVENARYVVYQLPSGSIRVVRPETINSGITIPNSDNAKKGTPIGATSYKLSENTSIDTIYYVKSNDGTLVKATKKTGGSWVMEGSVPNSSKPSAVSTIAAASDEETRSNIIVYTVGAAGSSEGMRYLPEPWVSA